MSEAADEQGGAIRPAATIEQAGIGLEPQLVCQLMCWSISGETILDQQAPYDHRESQLHGCLEVRAVQCQEGTPALRWKVEITNMEIIHRDADSNRPPAPLEWYVSLLELQPRRDVRMSKVIV